MEVEYIFKIIIIGDAGVGKSNILTRYTKNDFDPSNNPTIGIEFSSKTILVNDKRVKLQIWDTAGQERYRAVAKSYYKGAQGVMITYDISKKETFEHLQKWLNEVSNNAPSEGIPVFIVGNKKDLVEAREVTTEEAEQFAKKKSLFFLETSALDNSDFMIEKVFTQLTEEIIEKRKLGELSKVGISETKQINIKKESGNRGGKKGCC